MSSVRVCLAGVVIEISSAFRYSGYTFRDFFTDREPDLRYTIETDMIGRVDDPRRLDRQTWEGSVRGSNLLEALSERLLDYDVLLMHGAAISVQGQAYVFSAPSGTGKTTHIRKWLERCPDAFVVNGDKPFIRLSDDGAALACGSPWAGKEREYANAMVPLKAIVQMERAEDNSIERISFAEAFPKLLEQTYRPEDPNSMRKTLKLMQRLNPAVSFWRFKFNNMKDDCFDVAYGALTGKAP